MKTLLHICCAPCSIACIDTLRQEGIEPVGFWYNPNIDVYKRQMVCKRMLHGNAQKTENIYSMEKNGGLS